MNMQIKMSNNTIYTLYFAVTTLILDIEFSSSFLIFELANELFGGVAE
jgi:hypothetical protein